MTLCYGGRTGAVAPVRPSHLTPPRQNCIMEPQSSIRSPGAFYCETFLLLVSKRGLNVISVTPAGDTASNSQELTNIWLDDSIPYFREPLIWYIAALPLLHPTSQVTKYGTAPAVSFYMPNNRAETIIGSDPSPCSVAFGRLFYIRQKQKNRRKSL